MDQDRRRMLDFALAATPAARFFAGGLAAAVAVPAHAAWPARPVRMIVPFPPGGGTDIFARPLSKVLSQRLGQPVVVDNRGGAGGTLGADIAAKSLADGYTVLLGAVHHAIAVSIYPKLGYDLLRDLAPVTMVARVPNVVVINPQRLPVRTFAEFDALVRRHPGRYNFATAGNGTSHHLTVELWKSMAGVSVNHVPYRGTGPALQDLLAGQVDFMFDGLGSSIGHIRSGKLLPLAVATAPRSPALPEVPTVAESGVKGYEASSWYALWAPTGTPADIIVRLQQDTALALQSTETREVWRSLGAEGGGGSPAQMGQFVEAEVRKWAKVVKDSGARLD